MPREEVGMKDTFDRKLEVVSKRPISDVVSEMIVHLEEIVRSEIRLAQTEIRTEIGAEIGKAVRQLVKPAVAVALFLYALGFLLLAAVYGLAEIMPIWLAALAVGGALAGIAALFWQTGRPNQTLKEDFSWIKKHNS
jgi:hypothetical protein